MFNKKIVLALSNLIALLLLLKAMFVIVIFVWSYVGTPPVVVFDPRASQMVNVLVFIQELGTITFLYLVAAATASIVSCKGHGSQAAARPALKASQMGKAVATKPAAKKKPATKKKAATKTSGKKKR